MQEYLVTLLKVILLHGCFSSFLIVQMVADPAKHHKSEAELNLLDKL